MERLTFMLYLGSKGSNHLTVGCKKSPPYSLIICVLNYIPETL